MLLLGELQQDKVNRGKECNDTCSHEKAQCESAPLFIVPEVRFGFPGISWLDWLHVRHAWVNEPVKMGTLGHL